jgi:hypothetical protein
MGRRPYATNEARCAPQQNSIVDRQLWVKSRMPPERSHVGFRQLLRTYQRKRVQQLCASSGGLTHRRKIPSFFAPCSLVMRYTLINSPPPAGAATDNADPCSYSRQKMQMAPARHPRFSFRLSWDAAGNWHSDLRSIDRLPPLRHPSTYSRCCG